MAFAQRIPSLAQLSAEDQQRSAKLVCIQQTSPSSEMVVRHGVEKKVHTVVKSTSFHLELGLVNNVQFNQVIDLRQFTVDAKLVYDTANNEEKTVDYVRVKPLEYKSKVNEQGDKILLDCRIKVLTSQHEDMFFRVKVRLVDPTTNETYSPSTVALSNPIKVISKPEQLKKRCPNKQRTLTDLIVEAVSRIEQEQAVQKGVLEQCMQRAGGGSLSASSSVGSAQLARSGLGLSGSGGALGRSQFGSLDTSGGSEDSSVLDSTWRANSMLFGSANSEASLGGSSGGAMLSGSSRSIAPPIGLGGDTDGLGIPTGFGGPPRDKEGFENPGAHFEAAFRRFLLVYSTLSTEERPVKIRKLLRNATHKDTERCARFIDLFSAEGLQRAANHAQANKSRSGCACVVCPYQKELERIDDFYEGFLSAPFGQGGPMEMDMDLGGRGIPM